MKEKAGSFIVNKAFEDDREVANYKDELEDSHSHHF